jgi:hypothetical protein
VLQISVDGSSQSSVSGPENWGDLLNWLEQGEGPRRRIVTAVRFGGVAVPTFREARALSRELREIGPIDVVTSSADDLLRESAQAAYDGVLPLGRAVRRMAVKLRAGHELAAIRDLPSLTSAVQTLTTLTSALSEASLCVEPHKTDFDALVIRFCRIVDTTIAAQVESNWRGVADVLERELAPTLDAWASVTRRIWKIA